MGMLLSPKSPFASEAGRRFFRLFCENAIAKFKRLSQPGRTPFSDTRTQPKTTTTSVPTIRTSPLPQQMHPKIRISPNENPNLPTKIQANTLEVVQCKLCLPRAMWSIFFSKFFCATPRQHPKGQVNTQKQNWASEDFFRKVSGPEVGGPTRNYFFFFSRAGLRAKASLPVVPKARNEKSRNQ